MAKQCGTIRITGTIGGICFYKMHGEYLARAKSSLSGKRVKTDPAFKTTMEYAGLLGRSSRLAAKLKTGLTLQQRKTIHHGKLTGRVQRLLKEGKTEEDILAMLRPDLLPEAPSGRVEVKTEDKVKIELEDKKREVAQGETSFAEEAIRNAFKAEKRKPGDKELKSG
jgi:hypothetical protein